MESLNVKAPIIERDVDKGGKAISSNSKKLSFEVNQNARDLFANGGVLEFSEARTKHIDDKLDYLKKWAFTSIGLAIVISSIAVGLLIWMILFEDMSNKNIESLKQLNSIGWISHIISRVVLFVIIEIFAFFYFSIAKSSLGKMQYLINERTNIELKLFALRTAITLNDIKSAQSILVELGKSERNFIMDKSQTTVEIERYKSENSTNLDLMKFVSQFAAITDKLRSK
jgi:hypothetical protein